MNVMGGDRLNVIGLGGVFVYANDAKHFGLVFTPCEEGTPTDWNLPTGKVTREKSEH